MTAFPGQSQHPKKRKYDIDSSDSLDGHSTQSHSPPQQKIKQEPGLTPYELLAESSMDLSPGMLGGSYQPIKWVPFQKQGWFTPCNASGHQVTVQTYRLDGDKGFNYSQPDKAFVCQKKNHFQITACVSMADAPQYIKTQEGLKPIEGFYLHFYGAKEEAPNQIIQVDQSQSDRSKKKFCPVKLQESQENSWKLTVGRLHFSDTTLNNMRKRGKPNPDQRYFLLVVGLFAHSQGREYPVIQQCSEKLIVRASNPGQFQDGEVEQSRWQSGTTPNSVCHHGNVGINTDTPDEALTVLGNVKVMGHIVQPSDKRVKEDITEVDTRDQLKNMQAINLYNYRYTEEFAQSAGIDDPENVETGVIAQELELVMPDAVKTTGNVYLENGEVIEDLKVVDKNRLFMESIGAVKELCNVTDSLENKIEYLEKFNKKLAKLKRLGSMRSTTSTDTDASAFTSISTLSRVTVKRKHKSDDKRIRKPIAPAQNSVCSNKFLQWLIIILVLVMAGCVAVICAVLVMEKAETSNPPIPTSFVAQDARTHTPRHGVNTIHPGLPIAPSTAASACTFAFGKLLYGHGCEESTECKTHCNNLKCSEEGVGASVTPPNHRRGEDDVTIIYETRKTNSWHVILDHGKHNKGVAYATLPHQTKTTKAPKSIQKDKPISVVHFDGNIFNNTRKRRAVGDLPSTTLPLERLDIKLEVVGTIYNLEQRNCLDCDKTCTALENGANTCSNLTYGVQLHDSFTPGETWTLKVDGRDRNVNTKLAQCPALHAGERCENTLTQRVSNTRVDKTVKIMSLETSLVLGVYLESSIQIRAAFGNAYDSLTDLCTAPLSDDLIEITVWFLRVCEKCSPNTHQDMLDRIEKVVSP